MATVKAGEPVNINYTINTPQNNNSGNASRSVLAMTKPAMMGVGLLALGTMAVGLFSMFRVPGLEEQIRELEAEVDRLEEEIDVLEVQNDRFEILNQNLNETLMDLVAINEDLNETATKLEDQVDLLDAEVTTLNETRNDLETEKDRLTQSNEDLKQLQVNLEIELLRLETLNESWTETNQDLEASTALLSEELDELEAINTDLTATTNELNETVNTLEAENERLDSLVTDLGVVNEYFVATSVEVSETLQEVQAALDNSITQNRVLARRNLANYYDDVKQQWRCRNDDFFSPPQGETNFYEPDNPNQDLSIVDQSGLDALNGVFQVVDTRMLQLMCLDRTNFELYVTFTFFPALSHEDGLLEVSYNNIVSAVQSYGDDAMVHYGLPICGVGCEVTQSDWEDASFDCNNVPSYSFIDPR